MKDMIRSMLRKIATFSIVSDDLMQDVKSYDTTAYDFITNIHTTAVLPISSVIISIILVLELARNATHMEGDHQMGVKIIAATMFKSALLVIAAQNSTMFLDAINEVSTKIIKGINTTTVNYGSAITDQVISLVSDLDTADQAGMIMMLLIPFLITITAQVIIKVLIFFRFAELYAMSAFASLPIAFLGHPDTKSMGVTYLQKYAAVSLQGATLMLSVYIYTSLMASKFIDFRALNGEKKLTEWMFNHYIDFVVPPILLLILIFASGKIAKSLVGQ
jgi:hypothetical protein